MKILIISMLLLLLISSGYFYKRKEFFRSQVSCYATILLFLLGTLVFVQETNMQKNNQGEGLCTTSGSNIYIMLDLSKSMNIRDIKTKTDDKITRLEKAKDFIDANLLQDHCYSLIGFAGDTRVFAPLNNNLSFIKKQLEYLDGRKMLIGGSNLSEALATVNDEIGEKTSSATILLITDGFHEPLDFDTLPELPSKIKFYTIGIGTEEGGYVEEWGAPKGSVVLARYNGTHIHESINIDNIQGITKKYSGQYTIINKDSSRIRVIDRTNIGKDNTIVPQLSIVLKILIILMVGYGTLYVFLLRWKIADVKRTNKKQQKA